MPVYFQVFPIHCCFCIWYCHCFRGKNALVHHIAVVQSMNPFPCNVVFMTCVENFSSFPTFSRRFAGFHDACVFHLANTRSAASFPAFFASGSGIGNSNFLRAFFEKFLEFFIVKINDINTMRLSSIVDLPFSTAHFCASTLLTCISKFLAAQCWALRSFAFLPISSSQYYESHGPRLYVCQAPNAFICVSGFCPSQTPNAFICVSPNAFICVSPNAFICVSPNAFICVSPNPFTCVSPNPQRNGARFAHLPLLASLARFLTV